MRLNATGITRRAHINIRIFWLEADYWEAVNLLVTVVFIRK